MRVGQPRIPDPGAGNAKADGHGFVGSDHDYQARWCPALTHIPAGDALSMRVSPIP